MSGTTGDVFRALADASRRHLLDKLREQPGQTLARLCEELEMSRQAVSKHLAILESANLVVARFEGRAKLHYLNPVPIQEVVDRWVTPYRAAQVAALTRLKQALESNDEETIDGNNDGTGNNGATSGE